ncbi:MAG TPA: alpha/beta fold hydrolase [Propylenella sp.]|nr:alpha/beta fold hydrolase [Propylenella sp.]
MNWLVNIVSAVAAAYAVIVAAMYLAQARLIFPNWLADGGRSELPHGAARLQLTTADGTRLSGVRLPPIRGQAERGPLLLGFPGNAWNAEAMALTLHELLPDFEVVVFHYRGYRPSGGRPSADAILADSVDVFDFLQKELGPRPTVAIGVSIGSPVAAYLANCRALAGLILVTPFDSLAALARDQYPWAPVRLLLRHSMPTIDFVRGARTPTAMIVAGRDAIVPPHRSEPLRHAIANLVFEATIEQAGHKDLYDRPAFRDAMRKALAIICVASQRKPSD